MAKTTCMLLISAVAVMAAVAPRGEAEIMCNMVASDMKPCLPYVTDKGPLGGCCDGVKGLYSEAQTTPDRQRACECLKSLASSLSDLDLGKASQLPDQCGVNIPYIISPSTDCSKIN